MKDVDFLIVRSVGNVNLITHSAVETLSIIALEMALWFKKWAILMVNSAFRAGSSKHGNARRA